MAHSTPLPRGSSPQPSYLGAWILAARPATFPAAIVPVIVGTAAAPGHGALRPLAFIAALLASLLIQIGTNFSNDYFDFRKGADTSSRLGPKRVTQGGLISSHQVHVASYVTFGIAALLGVYLIALAGWPILVAGILSILCGIAYTGGPWPLGYHGLGDLFVFIFFGVVAVVGSAYVQAGEITALAVAASIPVGLLTTAILVVNNLRDIETDRRAGKRTLAVRIGRQGTRAQYILCLAIAYVVPLALWLAGILQPWYFWLPWLSLPLAVSLIRVILRTADGPTLNGALKGTGQLLLVFGILFAISLVM